MTEGEIQIRRMAAMALRRLNVSAQYWVGYMWGLRRFYHGENFVKDEEHKHWLSLIDDPTQEDMGRGYRAGLEGKT
jgi:hypothetical protein